MKRNIKRYQQNMFYDLAFCVFEKKAKRTKRTVSCSEFIAHPHAISNQPNMSTNLNCRTDFIYFVPKRFYRNNSTT